MDILLLHLLQMAFFVRVLMPPNDHRRFVPPQIQNWLISVLLNGRVPQPLLERQVHERIIRCCRDDARLRNKVEQTRRHGLEGEKEERKRKNERYKERCVRWRHHSKIRPNTTQGTLSWSLRPFLFSTALCLSLLFLASSRVFSSSLLRTWISFIFGFLNNFQFLFLFEHTI